MCGRYLFWDSINPDLQKLVSYAEEHTEMKNISIHDAVPGSYCFSCVSSCDGRFHTGLMKWGYPGRGRPVINARSETCLHSYFFENSHPCVLPHCGYYEWDADKNRYLIRASDSRITYLCGLYRIENGIPVFVIVTQPADNSIKDIHERQPVIFDRQHAELWCTTMDEQLFSQSLLKRSALLHNNKG